MDDASSRAKVTLPGGIVLESREQGLVGSGYPAGGALAYPRANGVSFWTTTGDGFEEWVEVENAGGGVVAAWELTGATLRQDGDAALVTDAAGAVRARVVSSRAYSAGGAEARGWLRVRGQVIELHTDARGAVLVNAAWGIGGRMATRRHGQKATLLPSGKVLVAGSSNAVGFPSSEELYDPAAGTWISTGALATPRASHTATLLSSGKGDLRRGMERLLPLLRRAIRPGVGDLERHGLDVAAAQRAHGDRPRWASAARNGG